MIDAVQSLFAVVTTVAPFLVVLSIVVFVHEYGHYIVGRWCGIGAEAFSIGFGRELYGWTDKRGTRWKLSALPLGGYVKFLGDADAASTVKDPGRWARLDAEQRAHSFHDASVGRRTLTVLAGPAANFVLSIAVFGAMALAAGAPAEGPVIGELSDDLNPAFRDAVAPGDRITAVNGEAVSDFATMTERLLDSRGEVVTLRVEGEGGTRSVEAPFRPPARVDGVSPDGPADAAGLAAGDVVTAVDGRQLRGFADLQEAVEAAEGAALTLTVRRGDETFDARLTPETREVADPVTGEAETRPLIGIQKQFTEIAPPRVSVGPLGALGHGVERTWTVIALSLSGIWDVISGAQAADEVLGGPVRIATLSGEAAAQGAATFVGLIAVLSTSIGLINLFPIPVLDGGHLVFYAIESVRGEPLRERWQAIGNQIGLALVLALMAFATFNDLARL